MKARSNLLIIFAILLMVIGCNLGGQETAKTDPDATPDESTQSAGGSDTESGSDSDESETETNDQSASAVGNKSFTVKFGKGKTSRSYKNSINSGSAHTYALGAVKGQVMKVDISSPEKNAVFEVSSPVGARLSDGDAGNVTFTRTLPASGSYKIKVSGIRGNASYTLNFEVTGGSQKEPPEVEDGSGGIVTTVKFKKGGTSASYKNAVVRGSRNTYILGAKAGQQMSVNITSVENNAVFQISGPKGALSGAGPGSDKKSWSGPLPADGKYRIIVGGTRGNATYNITIAIK